MSELLRQTTYLPASVRSLEQQSADVLGRYYDKHTVDEWAEQHFRLKDKYCLFRAG